MALLSLLAQAVGESTSAQMAQIASGAVGPLDAVVLLLQSFGFFRVVLPFLLVFVIVYAVLMKTGVLGKDDAPWRKPVAGVVAMAMAFYIIAYTPVINALAILLPQASFLLILIVLIMMILALLGFNFETGPDQAVNKWMVVVALVIIVVFVAMLGVAFPQIPVLSGIAAALAGQIAFDIPIESITFLVAILVIFGIIGAVIYL